MDRRPRALARAAAGTMAITAAAALGTACSSGARASAAAGHELVGLFKLTPGAVNADGSLTGTYFRMVEPGANPLTGPYMVNSDSPADGGQATLLQPGTAGGLWTNAYQSQPVPGFAPNGDSLSNSITVPTQWYGVKFSISTNPKDLQDQTKVPPPTVWLQKNGRLTANLSSWDASWNNQNFNQGAPKPVLGTAAKVQGQQAVSEVFDFVKHKFLGGVVAPTETGADATGTYDATTHAFVLTWTSRIQAGPFNDFTGFWHLQGFFVPEAAAATGS